MLTEPLPLCPRCTQSDKSFKVSVIYLEGSAFLNHQKSSQDHELDEVIQEYLPAGTDRAAKDQFVSRLVALLSPPSGEKQVLRLIHPDGMTGVFLMIAIIMLYQTFISQRQYFPIMVIILAACMTAYMIFRNNLVSRYNQKKQAGQQEIVKIERAVSRWMGLYFCARDQGVYDPLQELFIPLEGLKEYLQQD